MTYNKKDLKTDKTCPKSNIYIYICLDILDINNHKNTEIRTNYFIALLVKQTNNTYPCVYYCCMLIWHVFLQSCMLKLVITDSKQTKADSEIKQSIRL